MSSELERLLRRARETLPEPDQAATRRARRTAVEAARRRPRRFPLAVGAALLCACSLGVILGASTISSGQAAPQVVGFGFLPEQGWTVLQSGRMPTAARPAQAIAANVRLRPEDHVDELPYSTLLALPRRGVVIIAGFPGSRDEPDELFPARRLPLRLRDASPQIEWGVQVRPERPLGQYQLRATVNGQAVDVHVYFGTPRPSRALLVAAQHQLDRLVVRSSLTAARVEERALPLRSGVVEATASRVIDRTFLCTNAVRDGERKLAARANPGFKEPAGWKFLASAGVSNRGTDLIQLPPNNKGLVGNTDTNWYVGALAGRGTPPPPEQGGGRPGIAIATRACSPSSASVPLSARGLSGGEAGYFDDDYECAAPRRVLVRMRGVFRGATSLRLDRSQGALKVLRATGDLSEAAFAVRTESGKPVAFGTVAASGKARLFTAPSCVAD